MFDKNLLHIPKMKTALALLAVSSLATAALIAGQALGLSSAIAGLWAGAGLQAQLVPVAVFAGCFAARQIIAFAQDTLLDSYSVNQAANMRRELLSRIFMSRGRPDTEKGTAALVTALVEGCDEVESYIRMMPPKLCGLAFIALPILCVEFALDWVSGIILLITAPVIFYFMILLGKQAHDRAERQYASYQLLSNHFIDTLRGLDVLRAFGASRREDARIFAVSEKLRESTIKTIGVATLSSALLDLTATLGVAAVAMMLAFRLLDGSMSLSCALAALMLAPEFYTPIRSYAADFHASLDAKNSLQDIRAILQAPARPLDLSGPDLPRWNAQSTLDVRALGFAYGAQQVLGRVQFSAQGFQKIAVVGASGSGKSTFIDLLCGFLQPTGGSFDIDGITVGDMGLRSWTEQLHYIPQNPYIFAGTLRQNIMFYTPDATENKIRQAVHAVGLDELVARLPQGLDTPIGEAGRGLSGGQAQRIALARAFLDDRPILIFDEPTAHLDIETELDLKKNMLQLMQGKLVIFATHRLHWLPDMDRVYTLEDGSMREARHLAGTTGTRTQIGEVRS